MSKRTWFITIAVIAISLAIWYLINRVSNELGDNDRPPIIITDGSTIFTAEDVGFGRGEWDGSGSSPWGHDHGKPGPKHFLVTVELSQDCPATAYDTKELTVTAQAGTTSYTYKVYADSFLGMFRQLAVDPGGQTPSFNATTPWIITLPGKPTSVTFTGKPAGGTPAAVTCTFGDHAKITVVQKHQ